MKLIVGLGNFDPEYSLTRHNAGFGAIEYIAKKFSFPDFLLEKSFFGKISRGPIENHWYEPQEASFFTPERADARSDSVPTSRDGVSNQMLPSLARKRKQASVSLAPLSNEKIILLKPETWMNLSGKSVVAVMHFYKIPPENIIIIFDDADTEFGTIRLREKGSSGGHNGIKSIIACIGTEDFPRIKIGIANEKRKIIPAEDFVLQKFSAEEKKKLPEIFEQVSVKLLEKISK